MELDEICETSDTMPNFPDRSKRVVNFLSKGFMNV
jgi:hypothetical protein